MANTLLTIDMITREALVVLHNKLTFLRTINRQYDSQFAQRGAQIGNALRIRKPPQYIVRSGLVMNTQDTVEEYDTLTVNSVRGVDMNFDSLDFTLHINDYSKQFLEPAMSRLASEIEAVVLENVYQDVWNLTGTPATTPATINPFHTARARLMQGLVPDEENLHCILDSVAMAAVAAGEKALFHQGGQISQGFTKGYWGRAAGLNFHETNMVPNHTNGTRDDTTPVVNTSTGITSGTAVITMTAFGDGLTYKKGDVFTIADVYAVNPETKRRYPHLQQWVVTADETETGSGDMSPAVSPTPYTSGARQNIELVSAGSGKLVTNLTNGGSGAASLVFTQHLAYHRDAFTFATADLQMPEGKQASRQVLEGISMRYWRDSDIINSKHPARFDVLFGYRTLRPEWAVRVRG